MGGELKIVLDDSRQALGFEKNHFIFQEQLKQIETTLRDLLAKAPESLEEKEEHRHDTIGVFAGRGVGKTSFMLSLPELLDEDVSSQLCFLPNLDPSMLEETEFFLVTLISVICKLVEEDRRNSCAGRKRMDLESGQTSDHYQEWELSLKQLAEHLIALDGDAFKKHLSELIQTPSIFAQQVLQMGRSGKQLARAFHKFVDASVKVLRTRQSGLKALVLRLDDADTALDKGWPVFETLRKYLTTPQLIVIAAGDLDLFDLVIWMNTLEKAKSLKEANGKIAKTYVEDLQALARQYQLKVLPLENRLHLPTPLELFVLKRTWQAEQVKVAKYTSKSEDDFVTLARLFGTFCEEIFGVKNLPADKVFDPYRNPVARIVPESNREFLRLLLLSCWPLIDDKENEPKAKAVHGLLDVYHGTLTDTLGDASMLREQQPDSMERRLFSACMDPWHKFSGPGGLMGFYSFEPQYMSDKTNRAMLATQGVLNSIYCNPKNLHRIFDYWFLLADVYLTLEYEIGFQEEEEVRKYLAHIHYYSGDQAPDMVSRSVAWRHDMKPGKIGSRKGPGFLKVKNSLDQALMLYKNNIPHGQKAWLELLKDQNVRHVDLEKKSDIERTIIPNIDTHLDNVDPATALVLELCTLQVQDGFYVNIYVSFLRFLAALGTMSKELSSRMLKEGADTNGNEIMAISVDKLLLWRQRKSYLPRKISDENQVVSIPENLSDQKDVVLRNENVHLIKRLKIWMKHYEGAIEPPPLPVLAYIWRHFTLNLYAQGSRRTLGELSVGEMLRFNVLAFLNAVLVGEMKWLMPHGNITSPADFQGIDYRNVISSPQVLIKNYKFAHEMLQIKCDFFKMWCNFPFFKPLLAQQDYSDLPFDCDLFEDKQQYSWNGKINESHPTITSDTMYPLLCALVPHGYYSDGKQYGQDKDRETWRNEKLNIIKNYFQ